MKITRAYIEGLVLGITCEHVNHTCPHTRTQSANEWKEGFSRGVTLNHFHNQTESTDLYHREQVKHIKKELGIR